MTEKEPEHCVVNVLAGSDIPEFLTAIFHKMLGKEYYGILEFDMNGTHWRVDNLPKKKYIGYDDGTLRDEDD